MEWRKNVVFETHSYFNFQKIDLHEYHLEGMGEQNQGDLRTIQEVISMLISNYIF